VTGQATADGADHRHRLLAVTAPDLVADDTAEHTARHCAEAGAFTLVLDRMNTFDDTAVRAQGGRAGVGRCVRLGACA
jgi:hypothetical protein